MAKMHGHYFGRGRKIMTRYFRRNASGLLLYFAYSIARIVGDVLLILLPVFATSSFNSAHMLKETGDLYLSKSFDPSQFHLCQEQCKKTCNKKKYVYYFMC